MWFFFSFSLVAQEQCVGHSVTSTFPWMWWRNTVPLAEKSPPKSQPLFIVSIRLEWTPVKKKVCTFSRCKKQQMWLWKDGSVIICKCKFKAGSSSSKCNTSPCPLSYSNKSFDWYISSSLISVTSDCLSEMCSTYFQWYAVVKNAASKQHRKVQTWIQICYRLFP